MKNALFGIVLLIFLSSCSLVGSSEKDKKIEELELKMNAMIQEQESKNAKILQEQEEKNQKLQLEQEKLEEEKKQSEFNKNLACVEIWKDLKKTYSNVISWYYNSLENRCYVRYLDKLGNSLSWPSDEMTPLVEPPKPTELEVWWVIWKLEEKVNLWFNEASNYCAWLYPLNSWRIPTKNEIDKARVKNKSLFSWEKFYWSSTPYELAEKYDTSYWIFWPQWTWWGNTWNWWWCSIWNTKCLWNDMRTIAVRCVKNP